MNSICDTIICDTITIIFFRVALSSVPLPRVTAVGVCSLSRFKAAAVTPNLNAAV